MKSLHFNVRRFIFTCDWAEIIVGCSVDLGIEYIIAEQENSFRFEIATKPNYGKMSFNLSKTAIIFGCLD